MSGTAPSVELDNVVTIWRRSFRPGSKEVMALEADYIDSGLNTFLKQLITDYSRIPWAMDIPVCFLILNNHNIRLSTPL